MRNYITLIDTFEQKVTGSFKENDILLSIPERISGKLRTGLMNKFQEKRSDLQMAN